jgi:glycosyltransferase involved in cell wall biosynthesis
MVEFNMKISIVIPCYNEQENIPLIFKRITDTIRDRQDVEILFVNNGSQDLSTKIFQSEMARAADYRFTIIDVPVNQGYGYGILQGLKAATGDVLAWTHADMQTDPKDVLTAFELWKSNPSGEMIVKGKRQGRSFLETLFTVGMQLICRAILGVTLDDINAQPKLFSRTFFEKHLKDKAPYDFSLDLYLLYIASIQEIPIKTVPVVFAERRYGEAKGGGSIKTRIKLIKRTTLYIFELRRKLQR